MDQKSIIAKTEHLKTTGPVCLELNSGLQICGTLSEVREFEHEVFFIKFTGPTSLQLDGHELSGHSPNYHSHGYSSPLGMLKNGTRLSQTSRDFFPREGLHFHQTIQLDFKSGIHLRGILKQAVFASEGTPLILSFEDCKVSMGDEVLFEPAWGTFDLGIGEKLIDVTSFDHAASASRND